jgi:hypothetical protein
LKFIDERFSYDSLLVGGAVVSCYVVAVSLLVWACFRFSPLKIKYVPHAFLGLNLLFFLVCRLSIFQYDLILNPDEALMAANAMKARYGWLNWNIVDPLTAGPLASSILAWPRIFGGDITLFSTRLTGAILGWSFLSLLFLTALRLASVAASIVAIFPFFLFLGSSTYFDFVHYTSEHLSLFLLATAIYALAASFRINSMTWLLASAFALGLVPFAKLQAAPLGAIVGTFVIARAFKIEAWRLSSWQRLGIVTVTALMPAIIFLMPLVLLGEIDDFFKSYLLQQSLRIENWSDQVPKMAHSTSSFMNLLAANLALVISGIFACVSSKRSTTPPRNSSIQIWFLALALALVPVTYAVVAAPGRNYTHYLLFFLPTLALLCVVALSYVSLDWHARKVALVAPFIAAVAIMFPRNVWEQASNPVLRAEGAFLQGHAFDVSRPLQWLNPTPEDLIVCWGWRAECYVDNGLRAATRDATNENQLYDTALKDYFRDRFLREFTKTPPDFIIDVVAPGSFRFNNPETQSIESFPAFADIVRNHYQKVSSMNNPTRCPRVYVSRERMKTFNHQRIAFASVTATASAPGHEAAAVDDGSVFESCSDYWLLPDRQTGSLEIRMHQVERVKSVALLNTRNGRMGDRSTRKLNLIFQARGVVAHRLQVDLQPFPHWTLLKLEEAIEADTVRVEVVSFNGKGAGINEIKLYRN